MGYTAVKCFRPLGSFCKVWEVPTWELNSKILINAY
jgi:hypothetical protein